jgi:hypothetical protein
MTYVHALTPVGDAVYSVLVSDATLAALATGGVYSDIPPDPSYPLLWIELLQPANYGGLGTRPGQDSMPGITLRLHVFQSNYGTMRDAQIVMARAIELLFTTPLAVTGYTVCGGQPLSEIELIPLPLEELNGVKVQELIATLDLIVEEAA